MNRILLSQQSYFISVLAHVLILIVAGLYFSKEVTTVQVGNVNDVLVQSYVAFTPHSITSEAVSKVQQDKSTQLADKKEIVSRNEKMSSRAAFSAKSKRLSVLNPPQAVANQSNRYWRCCMPRFRHSNTILKAH